MRVDRPAVPQLPATSPQAGPARPAAGTPQVAGGDTFERYQGGGFAAFAVVAGQSGMGPLQSFGKLPEVNPDNPADWQRFHQAGAQRTTGGRAGVLDLGAQNPWNVRDAHFEERIAVGWALQQNPNLKYDADARSFFVEDTAGTRRDVAALGDVIATVKAHGGFTNGNGAAMQAVGAELAQRVQGAAAAGGASAVVVAAVVGQAEVAGADDAGAAAGRERRGDAMLQRMLGRFLDLLRSLFGAEQAGKQGL